ncbi:unnamed protein product, partial [marine sediment metagenome]
FSSIGKWVSIQIIISFSKIILRVPSNRTRDLAPGDLPIENIFGLTAGTEHFLLEEDMLKINCVASAPHTCSATYFGGYYCNSVSQSLLWCDGSTWQEFTETADIIVHNNLSGIEGTGNFHFSEAENIELNGW